MITRTVEIGSRSFRMSCSALVPRLYRRASGRDLIRDMMTLRENYNRSLKAQIELKKRAAEENREINDDELRAAQLSSIDLEIFENLAWAFVKDAERDAVPNSPDEWLNDIDGIFSIYTVFPAMCQIWNESNAQTSTPAKK